MRIDIIRGKHAVETFEIELRNIREFKIQVGLDIGFLTAIMEWHNT